MAARYSDRFFGPQGVSGRGAPMPVDRTPADAPPTIPRPHPSGPSAAHADEIDLVGGTEGAAGGDPTKPPPSRDRSWHADPLARLTLVFTLVVGLALGAYGWDRWRDRQAESVARSVVDVSADASLLMVDPDAHKISMSVHLDNEGNLPVTVTGFTPLDPRMSEAVDDFEPVDLAAGDGLDAVVDFGLDCSVELDPSDGDADTAVVAHVRTLDGAEHDQSLTLVGSMLAYGGGGVTEQCSYVLPVTSFQDLYPQIYSAELVGTEVVEAELSFYSNGGAPVGEPEVISVEAPSLAFEATWDGSFAGTPTSPLLTVRFTVQECENALRAEESDMLLNIRGSLPADELPTSTSSYPPPELITQLVRLSELVCR